VLEWQCDDATVSTRQVSQLVGELRKHAPAGSTITVIGPKEPQAFARRACPPAALSG
jgi:hypothetical protein